MTTYKWLAASGGDWITSADWSPTGGPPKYTDAVIIGVTGSAYSVDVTAADYAASLTLSSANATLASFGASALLRISGTFAMSAGTLEVATSSSGSGAVHVGGVLDLSGGTLEVNSGGVLTLGGALIQTGGVLDLETGGEISGGVLHSTAGTIAWNGGTLNGVTFDGPLNMSAASQSVHLADATHLVGSAGSGPGTINLTGLEDSVYFDGVQTISNLTINMSGDEDYLYGDYTAAANKVLTLQSSVTVNVTAESAGLIYDNFSADDIFVNQGIINDTAGTLIIAASNFTNSGAVNIVGGTDVRISGTNFTNSGTFEVAYYADFDVHTTNFTATASSVMEIGWSDISVDDSFLNQGVIDQNDEPPYGDESLWFIRAGSFVNSGTINAKGEEAQISTTNFVNSGTIDVAEAEGLSIVATNFTTTISSLIEIEAGFTTRMGSTAWNIEGVITIGSGAELDLVAVANLGSITISGGTLDISGSFANDSRLQLASGTLETTIGTPMTNGAQSRLSGYGMVNLKDFYNYGTIEAHSGTLTILNPVTGSGVLEIDGGADLVIDGAISAGATANFAGDDAILTLGSSSTFLATIGGFEAGDIISLVGITGNGVSVNASQQLVVTENGTTVATLKLEAAYPNIYFRPVAVSGGTNIVAAPLPATIAQYVAAVATYDQIPGGFSISDTATNIGADLDDLNDSHIASITISDNGAIGVSVGQISSDSMAIAELINQNGSPYQLAISDTASNIAAAITLLQSDLSHVASITASGGLVAVAEATFAPNRGALDKITGGFEVADSLPTLIANLGGLNADAHIDQLSGTSGTATIKGGATIAAPNFALTGSGTLLTVSEKLAYAGAFDLGAGATAWVSAGDALTLTGTSTLAGLIAGGGALDLAGGAATFDAGAKLGVADWSILGASTLARLDEAVTYGGGFSAGDAATIELTSGALTLTGAASFTDATLTGANQLSTLGPTTLSGLTLAGGLNWANTKTITEVGGALQLGDESGNASRLWNGPTGVYDIADGHGVTLGTSTASSIINAGLFEKTGSGISTIAPNILNAGTILAASATLDLNGAVTGAGAMQVNAGADLKVDKWVGASQTLFFNGSGGEISLDDLAAAGVQLFHGSISNFGVGDMIDVGAPFGTGTIPSFQENLTATGGTLTLTDGPSIAALSFLGGYKTSNFTPQADGHGGTLLAYAG